MQCVVLAMQPVSVRKWISRALSFSGRCHRSPLPADVHAPTHRATAPAVRPNRRRGPRSPCANNPYHGVRTGAGGRIEPRPAKRILLPAPGHCGSVPRRRVHRFAALTIARMPARTASGSSAQASTTARRSGSKSGHFREKSVSRSVSAGSPFS